MANPNQEHTLSPTATDLELALAFYSVLVERARRGTRITYGELVECAKAKFPANQIVQNAIAVSAGRRLDFVREFTRQRNLPDLTSLVINKTTGECGVGFTRNYDPDQVREEVFTFDWSSISTEFTSVLTDAARRAKPMKKLKEDQALIVMSEYYQANKGSLPSSIRFLRAKIVTLLMEGHLPEEAFTLAQEPDA